MTIDNIKEEIYNAESIIILTHEMPDGDAIGSSLAMYNGLKQLGKDVEVVMANNSKVYDFLPGANEIKSQGTKTIYDLAIALDCGDIKRLNGYTEYFENANSRIEIDHHGINTMFADYNFVNPAAPACAQILITVLENLNIEITKEIGTCLLTGIITDTGGFKNSGTTTESFEFAAWALSKGINVSKVYRQSMLTMTKSKFESQKLAMERLEFFENGKIAYTYMTKEDDERLGVLPGDHDGIVEIGRNIEGVEVSIFIYEKEKGYKASLRSNDYVNVSEVCMLFGGGGHIKAAGANMNMPLEDAKKAIIEETAKHLK